MNTLVRRIVTARAPYRDTRATLTTYVALWALFVAGLSAVAAVQVAVHALDGVPTALGRYAPSLLGATITLVLASSVNVVVNRRAGRRAPTEE